MQELNKDNVILSWWVVITDRNEYKLSQKEMEGLLSADSKGMRFIMFDKFMLNVAFVKEAYRKREKRDTKFYSIPDEEKKYLVEETKLVEIE